MHLLPPEIIVYILRFSSLKDSLSLQQTCKSIYTTIQSSLECQYKILLEASGMLDNPHSPLDLKQKYDLLKARERAWLLLEPRFTRSIPVDHSSVVIYELAAGAYLLSDRNKRTVDYLPLPSSPTQISQWTRFPVTDQLLDFGISNNLLVIVTLAPSSQITISFIHLPSGNALGSIPYTLDSAGRTGVAIEILGHLVAIVLYDPRSAFNDHVLILNWKKCSILTQLASARRSYQNATFLSTDLLLVPNAFDASIEIWRLPTDPCPHLETPDVVLLLPKLNSTYRISDFGSRAAPNSCPNTDRPFCSDPSQAIIVFHLTVAPTNARMTVPFIFFIHRKSFFELLSGTSPVPWSSWGPPRTRFLNHRQTHHADWITTTSGQRYVLLQNSDPFSPPDHHNPIMVYDFNPAMVNRVRVAEERRKQAEEKDRERFEKEREKGLGHRTTLSDPGPSRPSDSSILLDIPLLDLSFNPLLRLGWEWSSTPKITPPPLPQSPVSPSIFPYSPVTHQIHDLETYDPPVLQKIFSEPVGGSLPYIVSTYSPSSSEAINLDGVIMDDERIIGIKRGSGEDIFGNGIIIGGGGGVEGIEVMWFG
ncbi:hypothetical protein VKT23_016387 [Stygiomarasmius scandens]|uniref:F-box domain-containing protein n=1 Tax=Marasmiellus scandens TaxID=2682957 RepID=A0ABR1IZ04_9AGAR